MKTKYATATALLAALLLPLAATAQNAETVTVTATGYGVDPAAAKKAAGRAAIEQVVGQLVDADTLVENDELVKDRILTHSAAFLEDVETVGAPTQADGLWTVKVLAKVRKTQLAQKLKAENVGTVALKKGKLFAQAASRQQEAEDAAAMAKAVFENFPSGLVQSEVCKESDGSPAVRVVDRDGSVEVDVRLFLDAVAWKEWARGAMETFDRLAASRNDAVWNAWGDGFKPFSERLRSGVNTHWFPGKLSNGWGHQDSSPGFGIAVAGAVRSADQVAVREYRFDGNNAQDVLDALWSNAPQQMALTVSIMADDDLLASKRISVAASPFQSIAKWGGYAKNKSNANFVLVPLFVGAIDSGYEFSFVREVRLTIPVKGLSAEALEDATGVETKLSFLVPDPKDAGRADWGWVPKPAAN